MKNHAFALRWLAATGLAATAGIHIALVPEHLREAPYAGALFIALSATAAALAILVVAFSGHELVWLAAGSLSLAALCAYVFSRSVGLPSLGDDLGDWLNPLGVAAVLCETATIAICWYAVAPPRSAGPRARRVRTGVRAENPLLASRKP